MNPLEPPPRFYISSDSDYHFQKKLGGDRILNIYLKIFKSGEIWKVESRTTIENRTSRKLIKEVKRNFDMETNVFRWIGSWDYMFLKPACINLAGNVKVDDEVESRPDNITREELGIFQDQTLLEINGDFPGLTVESEYLDEVSGKPKNTDFPTESYPSNSKKYDPDEKENQSEVK
jgi:hypothetical protein